MSERRFVGEDLGEQPVPAQGLLIQRTRQAIRGRRFFGEVGEDGGEEPVPARGLLAETVRQATTRATMGGRTIGEDAGEDLEPAAVYPEVASGLLTLRIRRAMRGTRSVAGDGDEEPEPVAAHDGWEGAGALRVESTFETNVPSKFNIICW